MSSLWIPFYLLFLLVHACRGQITLSVQPNVTSNAGVCPNSTVVFTCNATRVGVLIWRVNSTQIETFTSSSVVNATSTMGQFTAVLIRNEQIQGSAARNYLSTLTVPSVSELDFGSVIGCLDDDPSLQSINVDFTIIGTPSIPSAMETVARSQDGSASITLTFNPAEYVDMYSIDVSGDQGVDCPEMCNPNGPCMCTGLMPGDDVIVNLNVTAVNCETQVGPVYEVSFAPRVPGVPSSCWVVPMYNATVMGPLVGVLAMWNNVSNPPYLTNKLNQNVFNYSVSVNGEMIPVPVGTACPMNRACSTDLGSYYNQSSNASFEVGVAATNLFGDGSTQTCDVPSINATNTLFNIVIEESGRTVQCEALGEARSNVFCQFCYGVNDCDNSLMCVNVTTTSLSQLSDVSEGTTYCYRVTAFVNGVPVALIQNTFTILSDSTASWLTPLLSTSIAFVCSVVLVFVAVIIMIIIFIFLMRRSNESTTVKELFKSLGLVDANGTESYKITAIILSIVAVVTLLLSILLLIAYGATANGYLVAAAFPFSLVALVSSITLLAVEATIMHLNCKMESRNITETEPEEDLNLHRRQGESKEARYYDNE